MSTSSYISVENCRVFRTDHLDELVPVDIRLEGLLVEIPDVEDVAHPDASDGHALEGDQAAEVVNLEEEKEF